MVQQKKPPETVRDCIEDLIYIIEGSKDFNHEEKGILLDNIRKQSYSYLMLKNFIMSTK